MKFSENYYSAMDPHYSSSMAGPRVMASQLGAPTSVATPLQLQQLTHLSSTGLQNIEVGPLATDKWHQIPKEHFDEMKRQAKLIGVKPSVHAPMEDSVGFDQQGRYGGESNRLQSVRVLKGIVDKSYQMDPDGNIPVNMHIINGAPGDVWEKGLVIKDEITGKEAEVPRMMAVIDPKSKQVGMMEYEERERPGGGKEIFHPMARLKERNRSTWLQLRESMEKNLNNYHYYQGKLSEIDGKRKALQTAKDLNVLPPDNEGELHGLTSACDAYRARMKVENTNFNSARISAFDMIIKANPKFKDSREYKEFNKQFNALEAESFRLQKEAERTKSESRIREIARKQGEANHKQEVLFNTFIRKVDEPQIFKPVTEWAKDEAAKTFSEIAMHGYSKYKDKSPTVVVENWRPDQAIGRPEDFRDAILRSREQMVEKLTSGDYKDKNGKKIKLSKGEAKKIAEKAIGATWDVGHVGLMRRYGYEDKDLIEATRKVADVVKHVHLTDNFGFDDSHLAPGMGNLPIKEMLMELEKKGKLKDARAIVEAGAVPAELKMDPTIPTFQYFDSPVYGWQNSPSWYETGDNYFFGSSGYSAGYGTILPDQHFSLYGGGFSQLPVSLGGTRPGDDKKSQFTGTPMS